ncbi:MAG: 50S ribosomal protein L6 [Planctomicrobium sp.]|jgi:large subunit ribosomal protein L6|nr:50S ribosomal protein L6 [Planctomicrobium sp.]
MSRIGKKPVTVADGTDISVDSGIISVSGKNGKLTFEHHPNMEVVWNSDSRQVQVNRPNDQSQNRALHGLTRALIANMVQGVQEPFVRKLEIQGVGYQATLNGNNLSLQVGFANTVVLPVPDQVTCELPSTTQIILKSVDKQAVGQFAANIRRVRPPEPYKGKGIRYEGEQVRRKAGKAFGS